MKPELDNISDISNEINLSVIHRNSIILNFILIVIFFTAIALCIYIFRDDKKKYTKNYILGKLLFIKRNT